jgi:hypothetical protein
MGMAKMTLDDQQDSAGCDGLCLHLSDEQIKALGLDKKLPADGATVNLRAIATVKRAAHGACGAPDADDAAAPGVITAGTLKPDTAQAASDDECAEGAALELHITRLEITQSGREPASVLYCMGERA